MTQYKTEFSEARRAALDVADAVLADRGIRPGPRRIARGAVDAALSVVTMNYVMIEYAVEMSGGGMHIRNHHPEIGRIYPTTPEWINHTRQNGGKVYRRRIVVVEDWTEVEP